MDSSLSLRDLVFYARRRKKFIVRAVLVSVFLFLGIALTRPLTYKAEATFVDRGKSQNNLESSALTLSLLGASENGGQVLSLLQSEKLLEKTVIALGLQAQISPSNGTPFFLRPFLQMRAAYAHFQNEKTPPFRDKVPPFLLKDLVYKGDEILSFDLILQENGKFSLFDKQEVDGGRVELPACSFTLERGQGAQEGVYHVHLFPLKGAIGDLKKSLVIEPSKKISELIRLDCRSGSRTMAAKILNTLMSQAELELQSIEREGATRQVAVLEARQAKSFIKLEELLNAHASTLSRDLLQIGFIDTEKALSFYTQAEDGIEKDLLKLEFEKRRLEEGLKLGRLDVERLSSLIDSSLTKAPFDDIKDQMRALKTKREALSIALLHQGEKKPANLTTTSPWEETEKGNIEIQPQLASLESTGKILTRNHSLLERAANPSANQWGKTLDPLSLLYKIEGMSLSKAPLERFDISSTYEGLSSDLSFDLLLSYQQGIDQVEEKKRQLIHLQEQIENEAHPLSAIAMSFPDETGKELGGKAKTLEVALQDPRNRSQKEQERIRDELSLERQFLKNHFKGLLDLLLLKGDLLKEKIGELRRVALSGIYQELSLLENEVLSSMEERLARIDEETELLLEERAKLHLKMSPLPSKWAEETLMKQKLHLHEHLFNEVTRLSENKEIASQLNLVLSAPLDQASPPPLPIDPSLAFFTMLGGFSGFFFAISFLLFEIGKNGLPATPSSLQEKGQKTLKIHPIKESLSLEALTDLELEGLRHLLTSIKKSPLFIGATFSLFPLLSLLFHKKEGKKVLLINLDGTSYELPLPKMKVGDFYDELLLPINRFQEEYLLSPSFISILEELKSRYPLVLSCSSKRKDNLLPLFDQMVITVDQESLEEFTPLFSEKSLYVFSHY